MASRLEKISIRDAALVVEKSSATPVFHVRDPHALIQASGYLKHVYAKEHKKLVFYRGQTERYATLSPSLFRKCTNRGAQDRRIVALRMLIEAAVAKSKTLRGLPEIAREPLLQHYGVRTTWIDLVDNIWIALWFACHQARVSGEFGQYLHYERRLPRLEADEKRFAYIVLVASDMANQDKDTPGISRGNTTELADLRLAAPSVFARPHAQHGVLFRLKGGKERRAVDYGTAIVGTIRVSLDDALEWLGEGRLLSVHALFPPPVYDTGYQLLLDDFSEAALRGDSLAGGIFHVGA